MTFGLAIALCLAAMLLAGCVTLNAPSRTEAWCLPHAKYSHRTERAFLGLRCAW